MLGTITAVSSNDPTLEIESAMFAAGASSLVALDEAGRGSPCGPVSVGAVLLAPSAGPIPTGLRDSKLLSPARREALVEPVLAWVSAGAVGHAEAWEVDAYGILPAIRLAALRACSQLPRNASHALVDGNYDWLTRPALPEGIAPLRLPDAMEVRLQVKGDRLCASLAAASILAKTSRDARMLELDAEHPGYGLARNKGYGSAEHFDALRRLGPTAHHRTSWSLPGAVD